MILELAKLKFGGRLLVDAVVVGSYQHDHPTRGRITLPTYDVRQTIIAADERIQKNVKTSGVVKVRLNPEAFRADHRELEYVDGKRTSRMQDVDASEREALKTLHPSGLPLTYQLSWNRLVRGPMSPTLEQEVVYQNQTSSSDGHTFTIVNPTSGNLLVVCHGYYFANATVHEPASSGFNFRGKGGNAANEVIQAILDKAASGSEGTSLTVTNGGRAENCSGVFYEVSGMVASPFVAISPGADGGSGDVTSVGTGNCNTATPNKANCWLVGNFGFDGSPSSFTYTNSFVEESSSGFGGGSNHGTKVATRIVSETSSTYNSTAEWTTGVVASGVMAAYEIAPTTLPTPYARTNWVATASSYEPEASREPNVGQSVLNGDTSRIWHTKFSGITDNHPHDLVIDMLTSQSIEGILQIPYPNNVSGRIENYRIYYKTNSGAPPSNPVNLAEWTQFGDGFVFTTGTGIKEQLVTAQTSRYLLIRTTDTHEAQAWASIAELFVLGPHDAGVTEKPIAAILTPNPVLTYHINVGDTLSFTGTGYSRYSRTPLTYVWGFNDAGTGAANSTAQNPTDIAFNTAGTFTIPFKVTDSNAVESDAATIIVVVTSPTPEPPTAAITSPPGNIEIYPGGEVNFSVNVSGGAYPYTHLWTFGAGSGIANNTNQSPGWIAFPNPGVFEVTYQATGDDALEATPQIRTVSVIGPPIIRVAGNGIEITNGDETPSLDDHSDFGATIPGTPVARTFTIHNDGDNPLVLDGTPRVAILGAGAAAFSVASEPAAEVLPDASTSVTVWFNPSASGTFAAVASIDHNHIDSNPFHFAITGEGLAIPSVPVADAGPNQTVEVGTLVQLDGVDSHDPDEAEITYLWALISVPSGSLATLSSTTIVNPTFLPDLPGAYVVRLIVNDGVDNSLPDEATITAAVLEFITPMFAAAHRAKTVPGNARRTAVSGAASVAAVWKYPKDIYDVAVDWSQGNVIPVGATALAALEVIVKNAGGTDVTGTLMTESGVEGLISWATIEGGTKDLNYDVIFKQTFNNGQVLERYVKLAVRDPRAFVVHPPFKFPNDKFPIPIEWAGREPRGFPALSTLVTTAYDSEDAPDATYVAGSFVMGTIGAGYILGGTAPATRLLEFAQAFANGRKFHEYAMLTVEAPPA